MIDLSRAPRIAGTPLKVLSTAVKNPAVRKLAARMMKKDLGIDALAALGPEERLPLPMDVRPIRARADHARADARLGPSPARDWPRGSLRIQAALREGLITPRHLAERAFAAARSLAERKPSYGPILTFDEERALRDADAATARWRAGSPLGPLDGVPITIKEEVDVRGLRTQLGTNWVRAEPAAADAPVVARLRAAGAVILGHTMMTEYGMTPLGFNSQRTMPRNPHDPTRVPGGSSSGAAVGVATGVTPVALGGDGGGSIRTPSCLNGVFGIKPTFGRISRAGDPFGGSVAHLGPIGASVHDLAVFLELTGGEDPNDELTHRTPPIAPGDLVRALGRGVTGLRIGVLDGELDDADDDVARRCREALEHLEKDGAVLIPVRPRLFKHAPAMGYLTIGLEFYSGVLEMRRGRMDELGPDLQVNCATLSELDGDHYLDAQKLRAALRREAVELLRKVDVLALPTTRTSAPVATDEELAGGFLDTHALDAMCRYAFFANLTGLPAATAPVGRDQASLPVGLQIVADAWDEATVLQVVGHLERTEVARVERPSVHVDLFG